MCKWKINPFCRSTIFVLEDLSFRLKIVFSPFSKLKRLQDDGLLPM